MERTCRPPRRRLRWRRREGPSCLARPTRQRRPPARRDSVKRRCSQPAAHAEQGRRRVQRRRVEAGMRGPNHGRVACEPGRRCEDRSAGVKTGPQLWRQDRRCGGRSRQEGSGGGEPANRPAVRGSEASSYRKMAPRTALRGSEELVYQGPGTERWLPLDTPVAKTRDASTHTSPSSSSSSAAACAARWRECCSGLSNHFAPCCVVLCWRCLDAG